jgi:methyl-accepting chemotaxis protein
MKNLDVAGRITIMVVVSAIALLVVGLVGLSVGNSEKISIQEIHDNDLQSIVVLANVRQSFTEIRVAAYKSLSMKENIQKNAEDEFEIKAKEAIRNLKDYERLISNNEDRKLLDADRENIQTYLTFMNNQVFSLIRQGQNEAAGGLMIRQGVDLGQAAINGIDSHMGFNLKRADDSASLALSSASTGRNISIACLAAGLLLVTGIGFFLAREIRERLKRLSAFINTVSQSLDFTPRIRITRMDELGTTGHAFNKLLDRMCASLKSIATGVQAVAEASDHLADTSKQVATASSHQSDAASNVAATVEEMTVSINHVGDRAQEANLQSNESERLADEGEKIILQTAQDIHEIADTVNQAAKLIADLEADSKKISGVISVIKEVADQTNLLALNAAIEAARAGEQGRGFAVVADEVRKLAERTASSTQEITHTITAMNNSAGNAVASMQGVVSKVTIGVSRARETSESIQQIGVGCRSAVSTVAEITSAIREQGAATNNIAVQVERIAQMSEESSAAASESSAAALHLDELAHEMQQIVSAYRIA